MLPETRNTKKQVRRNQQGIEDINDRGNEVFRRISNPALRGGGGNGGPTRAVCTADAGFGVTIAATLFNADGSLGNAVTVICNISNGSDLNEAVPRLEIGDQIFVTESNSVFYCVSNFQSVEICICEEP
jgi:hypothetical protein